MRTRGKEGRDAADDQRRLYRKPASIRKRVFIMGQEVENLVDHPLVRPSLNACAMTYELAQQPEYADWMLTTSNLTGQTVNRFTHLHQNAADLVAKVKMLRLLGQKTGCCFQRCVGMDAFNAMDSVTYEMDRALGTEYHTRFRRYLQHVQEHDLVVDGAMTDPKGDRRLAPSQQADPDLFVHVVEKKPDGIMVRGAKLHQTGALNSHEIMVMPTQTLSEKDQDYAVAFAVPADAPGILMIYGRQPSDTRKLESGQLDVGNREFGGHEAVIVLDNVFVPWERVFMAGEYAFSGLLVERFAGYHRQSYGGCKVGVVMCWSGQRSRWPVPRHRHGLACQGQDCRDGPSQRNTVCVRHRVLGGRPNRQPQAPI